jgi:hypothetical protein
MGFPTHWPAEHASSVVQKSLSSSHSLPSGVGPVEHWPVVRSQ